MMALPACQAELSAFLGCATREPFEHWECDVEGSTPALKDGYCDGEQGRLVACMEQAS